MKPASPGRFPARPLAAGLVAAAAMLPGAFAAGQTVSLHTGGRDVRIVVGEAAALPADFPADVALPRTFAPQRVERTDTTTLLEGTVAGDVGRVAAELRARMQADGWSAATVDQPASGSALAWEKDARAVTAWLRPAEAEAVAGASDGASGGVRLQLTLLPRR